MEGGPAPQGSAFGAQSCEEGKLFFGGFVEVGKVLGEIVVGLGVGLKVPKNFIEAGKLGVRAAGETSAGDGTVSARERMV